jgi:uncharacterized protein YfiM (DUF2279 family)
MNPSLMAHCKSSMLQEAGNKKGLDQKLSANRKVNRMLSSNPSNSTPSLD